MNKNVIILGAGFGGVRCALDLAQKVPKDWHIFLVDRNSYHVYYPRLYEEIVEGKAKCVVEVKEILKGIRVEFVQGEVKGVDCKSKQVVISRPQAEKSHTMQMAGASHKVGVRFLANARNDDSFVLQYDYLVLALGAGTDYFGIEGLPNYACTLKSLKDAEVIRGMVGEFLSKKMSRLEVVIGGAGATGVEVAAELAYLFRRIPREKWSVTLVEALGSVLWMFKPEVGKYAQRRLKELGVHTMLDTCIKRVEPAQTSPSAKFQSGKSVEVVLAPRPLRDGETEAQLACDFLPEHEKRMRADLLLWAGGVRANPFISQCGIPTDRKGRVEVDGFMRVKGLEGVFAIGDNAALINPATKQPVPATAQAALEQGKLVAENIGRLIKSGGLKSRGLASGASEARPLTAYRFHDFPAIIPLANRDAVAYLGGRAISGFPAWLLRQGADFRYYCSTLPWWKAALRYF